MYVVIPLFTSSELLFIVVWLIEILERPFLFFASYDFRHDAKTNICCCFYDRFSGDDGIKD